MSRSGYGEDYNNWALIRWRGAVASATKGARGQAMLKELLAALDALETKRLITNDLIDGNGEVCALGALGEARGLNMTDLDPYDREAITNAFGVADALAAEVMYMNDEALGYLTPEERFQAMRHWIAEQIR